ncbi:MAG: transglutaminase family protein [Burkholderiaceae bacterium]|jgi:hypothetical protein|nr:transglutaminase family protein [Burkholderiaceae bacterium]MEB2318502.1 transglutaminase family protein [Pseudomonadota bacterium]
MSDYLHSSAIVDWQDPRIMRKARELAVACTSENALVKRSFEFVRDAVREPAPAAPLAVSASDVLATGSGCSFAKTHLLVALLRANRIPAGLCYQRLACRDDPGRFGLHGLAAARLSRHGWYRLDPSRGTDGLGAGEFCPPVERFARHALQDGEGNLPEVWTEPLPIVIDAMRASNDSIELGRRIPDIELVGAPR